MELNWKLVLMVILFCIVFGIGGFVAGRRTIPVSENSEVLQTISPTIPQPTVSEAKINSVEPTKGEDRIKWVRTNTLGNVSFEYPFGWHIAVLWPNTYQEGIRVVVDKEPINTAPRGGSLEDLFIYVLNGIQNPEEELQDKINIFKKDMQNVSESNIRGLHGNITYIKGLANVYEELWPVEGYFFLIPASNTTDKLNYQVISSTIGSDSEKAPILRHTVESFKRGY